jgi:hypothetical protein
VFVCPYFSFEAVKIFTKGGLNIMSLQDTLVLLFFISLSQNESNNNDNMPCMQTFDVGTVLAAHYFGP